MLEPWVTEDGTWQETRSVRDDAADVEPKPGCLTWQGVGGLVPEAMKAEQLRPEGTARQHSGGLVLDHRTNGGPRPEVAARQVESRPVAEGSVAYEASLKLTFCGNPAPILPHTKLINLPLPTHQCNETPVLPSSNFSFGEISGGSSVNPSRITSHRRVRVHDPTAHLQRQAS